MMQVDNLEKFLAWVRSSPCQFTLSSMSGGCVHVKFTVPCDKAIGPNEAEQFYKSFNSTENVYAPNANVGIEDRNDLMNKCYEDGFKDGRLDMYHVHYTEKGDL